VAAAASDELVAEKCGTTTKAIGGRSPSRTSRCAGRRLRGDLDSDVLLRSASQLRPFQGCACALAAAGVDRTIAFRWRASPRERAEVHRCGHTRRCDGMRFDPAFVSRASNMLDAFAERCAPRNPKPDELVVFTAHSLPKKAVDAGDRYAGEVAARPWRPRCTRCRTICRRVSERRTDAEPWDVRPSRSHRRAIGSAAVRSSSWQPIGFVCDHTEIMYRHRCTGGANRARVSPTLLRRPSR